jgi:hypothetical protein
VLGVLDKPGSTDSGSGVQASAASPSTNVIDHGPRLRVGIGIGIDRRRLAAHDLRCSHPLA